MKRTDQALCATNLIYDALFEAARPLPDGSSATAYIFRGKEISFRDVDEASDRVAAGLLALGVTRGDRIGMIGTNQPEWLYTYFAAAKIGATVVALNVRYRDVELEYMLNQSETKVLVTITDLAGFDYTAFFDSFRKKIPTVTDFIFIPTDSTPAGAIEKFRGAHSYRALLETTVDEAALLAARRAVTPDDLIIIIYTSGTTGRPKGAAISHRSQLASARAQVEHARMTHEDSMLVVLPLNHVGGITCAILSSVLAKAPGVLIPVPDPADVIKQAAAYKPTVYGGVPTLYTILFMNPEFLKLDMGGVRLAICGGSNAEPALLKQIQEVFGNATVMNLYGLSETSGAVVLSPWESDFDTTVRSIGKPIGDFRVKVVDPRGKELPTGEVGELCFSGDAVCRGYFRMPEETAEIFEADGWLHTGDMGSLDEGGYITLKGRKKEMYLQGGYNVYPVEVENLLTKHPSVLMAAGIGVPDPVLGEVGRYYVVPRPGTDPTEDELKTYCREHLADYKVPRRIVFRESLPLTPVGKIMKLTLKEEFEKTGK
jgi:acyl-CoA synthetase (AMP-forming)/AMP-acid ligase II